MSPAALGARGRCPRCGLGTLFAGLTRLAPTCAACGLPFGFDVGDAGAPFLILIVGVIAVVGAVVWQLSASPPWWAHALVWPPVVSALTIGLIRVAKGALAGQEYRTRAAEHRF